MNGVTVRRVGRLASADRDAIVGGLLAYNDEHGFHWAGRELSVVARDRSGRLVGGLLGETNGGWLFVWVLWVADSYRGQGIGSALLADAEREARRRKCIGIYLDTYSFQARPFYERLGYRLFGTLPDCPPGGARYYLFKRLDGGPTRRRSSARKRRRS
jgi:GNAT superfamily N-acetyltransferase